MLLFVSNSPACLTDMVFLLTLLIIFVHKKIGTIFKGEPTDRMHVQIIISYSERLHQ